MKKTPLLILAVFAILPLAQAATIHDFAPLGGLPGETITVSGDGFVALGSFGVDLNGTAADVSIVDDDTFTFQVPSGAASGKIALVVGGAVVAESPFPFQARREVTVGLDLPDGLPYNYVAATGRQIGTVLSVPKDTATMVWAVPDSDDEAAPFFAAVVLPSEEEVTISVRSTAIALPFLSPYLNRRDASRSEALRDVLAGLPEVAALEQAIETAVDAGIPYLDDVRVEETLLAAIEAALRAPAPASLSAPGPTIQAEPPPPDTRGLTLEPLQPESLFTEPRLELEARNLAAVLKTDNVPNAHLLTLATPKGETNPLDWIVEIYQVHPRSIPQGISSLSDVSPEDPLEFLYEHPVAAGHVRAKLGSENVDLMGHIGTFLMGVVNSFNDPRLGANDFLFDRDVSGVFVVQAYSGNLSYGTRAFLATTNQIALLNEVDRYGQWGSALTTNVVVATLDVVSVAVDVQDFVGKDAIVDLAQTMYINVGKTLAAYHETEGLSPELFFEVVAACQKTVLQKLTGQLIEGGAAVATFRLAKGIGKTVLKVFDITGKISSVEQAVERTAGLTLPNAFAIERTLVVINNPFVPRIDSFNPRRGRGGEIVRLDGSGFGFELFAFEEHPNEDIEVSLCTFPSTTTDPNHQEPPTAQLPLEIVSRHENRIEVRIPPDFGEMFPEGGVFCIETEAGLAVSRDTFGYIPPPALTGVEPAEVFQYNNLSLVGENFQSNSVAVIDGFLELQPVRQTASRLTFILPPDSPLAVGEHSVVVKSGEHETGSMNFLVKERTPTPPDGVVTGVDIYVTTAADVVAEDGEMSLREAILIANGTRGAVLERHFQCELEGDCEWRDLDIDHMVGFNDATGRVGGPSQIDSVFVDASLGTLVLDSDLPPLGAWDTVHFRDVMIDAGNAITGLLVTGGDGLTVSDVQIRNASGPGIHVMGDSDGATLHGLTILDSGGGILIDQDSDGNAFNSVMIENPAGHGVHITGGADGNQLATATITDAGGHGVFLEDEAKLNRLMEVEVVGSALSGVRLSGAGVRYNQAVNRHRGLTDPDASYLALDIYRENGGFGLLIENGASFNVWAVRHVMENAFGGVCIRGAGTDFNHIGKIYRRRPMYGMVPSLIYFNGGPGITLSEGARNNTVQTLNIVANDGDGILIDNAHENVLATILTGEQRYFYDPEQYDAPPPAPNRGNSIHLTGGASGNIVTAPEFNNGLDELVMANLLQFDLHNGILIEGERTSENFIHRTTIRSIGTVAINGEPPPPPDAGNGIEIRGGASDNRIGEPVFMARTRIENVAGAGILIRDAATVGNTVAGCYTSWAPEPILHESAWAGTGVYLTDGARGNRVGVPGPTIGRSGLALAPSTFTNSFSGAVAGLVLDDAGGSVDQDGERVLPNVIASNQLTGPIGLLVKGGAEVNDIGGKNPPARGFVLIDRSWLGDANTISGTEVGIKIDTTPLSAPAARNRFMNNTVSGSLSGTPDPVPPLIPVPASVGLLITGQSDGHIVGETWEMRNTFNFATVPVYLDGCSGVEIYAAEAGYSTWFSYPAALVLHEAEDSIIGSDSWMQHNFFGNGGIADDGETANVVIFGGSGNRIAGNTITGGKSDGILIESSASNRIGGAGRTSGNSVLDNDGSGITITGSGALNNTIQHNLIGIESNGTARPNGGHGIQLIDQAAGTLVGGRTALTTVSGVIQTMAPNRIAHNVGYGVYVSGTGSTENSIANNSIFSNGSGGIQTINAGNHEIAPPTEVLYSGGVASGNVDTASAPPGSRVQLFSDAGDQGEIFLGEAEVKVGGTWSVSGLPPAPLPEINATVTDLDGNTSVFARGTVERGFTIARSDGTAPGDRAVDFDAALTVLPLTVEAAGADVHVHSLTVSATGTLDDIAGIGDIRLYRDSDHNGALSEPDAQLSQPDAAYEADDGRVTLNLEGVVVRTGEPVNWLLVYTPGTGAAEGETFRTRIEAPTDVSATHLILADLPVTPVGVYPISSDTFTIQPGMLADFAAWKADQFGANANNEAISGVHRDPDGDGMVNGLEYALGLDPLKADRDRLPTQLTRDGTRLTFTYRVPTDRADVTYHPSASTNLTDWSRASAWIESITPAVNPDGTQTVTVTVDPGTNEQIFIRLEADIEQE